jgi:hypothetical protein
MSGVLPIITIFALVILTIIDLSMMMAHADDDSSEPPYCAKGEGKDGIRVKICSMDKEKCDEKVRENDIFASCHKIH